MNTSANTVSSSQIACRQDHNAPKRRWFTALWQRTHRQSGTANVEHGAQYDPWTTAVSQIDHLDAHVLADIGAPRWVIDEVNRRQQNDGILNAGRKW